MLTKAAIIWVYWYILGIEPTTFHEVNSHLFAEESRHHNPDDP